MKFTRTLTLTPVAALISLALSGCVSQHQQAAAPTTAGKAANDQVVEFYGTKTPFASQSVYFLLTDRFVDGDSSNNQETQGGEYPTFNRPLKGPDGQEANVGYMGGDFQGVLNNADYIRDMGFTSVWLTPIFDNPDQAYSGGEEVVYGSYYKDGGKTGYHGYWPNNFYHVDEHLPSKDLTFADFTRKLKQDHDLNFILDVVTNHGSPAYGMPEQQEKFGVIYDENWQVVADHQNIHPEKLDPNNPMHAFFNTHTGLAQLSDVNENSEAALDYFEGAYLKWIAQGVHALRVDTIKEMPHHFWKKFFDRIRKKYPDIFIFGESYSYEAEFIAEHTREENGGVSVLDFPGRKAISELFQEPGSDFKDLIWYLHLDDGVYQNPYDLMTFYDNHDMERMNASDMGFVDANNWLFTSRGIPVIYYGSEVNFMTGKPEHQGNRNYLGQEKIEEAKTHIIHNELTRIAQLRKNTVALQRGLQHNLDFSGQTASFYRVYQDQERSQTALVLLNKGDSPASFTVTEKLSQGTWTDAFSGEQYVVNAGQTEIKTQVKAHGVKVLLNNGRVENPELITALMAQQQKLNPEQMLASQAAN
ncbi:cyclomaltodextrin glucanotransferase [Thalassomonas viridans]|uniref:Cyclomaltodextrin glucanotransferase n=1 Tax=Thalassomonas viridans TaxID=137584 RepID=A0AAE9Z3Q4_9GAMM|nr:alpha-amylase family glycosyl hydrolase [Thalassomonas viridans]WDE04622.1 cyclomaltodextrin glucanotransferase [Thalassomonas viridans]